LIDNNIKKMIQNFYKRNPHIEYDDFYNQAYVKMLAATKRSTDIRYLTIAAKHGCIELLRIYRKPGINKNLTGESPYTYSYFNNKCEEYYTHTTENEYFKKEACHLLQSAMRGISKRDRQILKRKYWKGVSQRKIAKRLGVTEGTVSARIKYLLEYLNSCFGYYYQEIGKQRRYIYRKRLAG